MLSRKAFDAEVKAGEDPGTITLYAATWGGPDRQGEAIDPGAFVNLDTFVKDGWIALSHDFAELPVATVESATQDAKGLLLTCRWHSTDDAQEARTVVKERMDRGKAVKCSIGYRVIEAATETRDGETVRVLKRIELFEASIVNLPANPKAEVVGVKHWADGLEEAALALKEGRVLSGKNRQRLERLATQCREAATDLETMLAETAGATEAPKGAVDAPSDDVGVKGADAGRRLVGDFLAHCAAYPTYQLRG
jgi:uncharacterized protein